MSYAMLIRDGMMSRYQKLAYFGNFKRFGTSAQKQVHPEDLNYLGVYLISEAMAGEAPNLTSPAFLHECEYAISVIRALTDDVRNESDLDEAFDALCMLLNDPTFFRNPTFMVEGVTRISRSLQWGTLAGSSNETPVGELKVRFNLTFRTDWPPTVIDDLKIIHVETAYPSVEEKDRVQQVIADYDLTEGET